MRSALLIPVLLASIGPAAAQKLVVSSDDHSFSNSIFLEAPELIRYANDPFRFQLNVLDWLGGATGKFLQFGDLPADLGTVSYNVASHVVVRTSDPTQLAHLSEFDGLIVGLFVGTPISSSFLTDYVRNGGNVYLYGGTAHNVSAPEEAARWAPFLQDFGIQFASEYRETSGVINVSRFSAHAPFGPALFTGVRRLEDVNDQPLSHINPNVTNQTRIFGDGYFAVAEVPLMERRIVGARGFVSKE